MEKYSPQKVIKRRYCVIIYVSHFCLPNYIRFLSDTCFIFRNTWLLFQSTCCLHLNVSFGLHYAGNIRRWVLVIRIWYVAGGGRRNFLRTFERKIHLARNILRQPKAWSRIPFQILILQGTGKVRFAEHAVVQPCDSDLHPAIDPSTYVLNGFLGFFHHELTQIW